MEGRNKAEVFLKKSKALLLNGQTAKEHPPLGGRYKKEKIIVLYRFKIKTDLQIVPINDINKYKKNLFGLNVLLGQPASYILINQTRGEKIYCQTFKLMN